MMRSVQVWRVCWGITDVGGSIVEWRKKNRRVRGSIFVLDSTSSCHLVTHSFFNSTNQEHNQEDAGAGYAVIVTSWLCIIQFVSNVQC